MHRSDSLAPPPSEAALLLRLRFAPAPSRARRAAPLSDASRVRSLRSLTLAAVTVALVFLCLTSVARATTWDEPWHEDVVKSATTFVRLTITANDGKSFTAKPTAQLAGEKVPDSIKVDGFHKMFVTSFTPADDHFRMDRFEVGFDGYFLLAKSDHGTWTLPTPTSGYARVNDGQVTATYRHSYHQALVPQPLYEPTMLAIFQHLHGQPYDAKLVATTIDKTLSEAPASLDNGEEEANRFFAQHVGLELFYYFGDPKDLARLEPFLVSTTFHQQISAARAVGHLATPKARARLVTLIETKDANSFAKVMALWALEKQDARDTKDALAAYLKRTAGAPEEAGFGGNIMDPRVGTFFPDSVQQAIETILTKWK